MRSAGVGLCAEELDLMLQPAREDAEKGDFVAGVIQGVVGNEAENLEVVEHAGEMSFVEVEYRDPGCAAEAAEAARHDAGALESREKGSVGELDDFLIAGGEGLIPALVALRRISTTNIKKSPVWV